MAYPPGISLAVIQAGKAGTFFGDAASLTATVTPVLSGTKYLVHQSTGDLMVPSPMTFTAANDSVLSFSVPHVDQAGYLDDNATPYTMWAYKVDVTVLIGNGRQVKKHTWTKNFQPLVGQDFIDIDQIASGVISEGVTAPLPEILSVNGQTGHVTVETAGATDTDVAAFVNDPDSATRDAVTATIVENLGTQQTAASDLVNSWWCQPRSLYNDLRGAFYQGGITREGAMQIAKFDLRRHAVERVDLGTYEKDDHNVPAFLIEDDQPPVAAMVRHSVEPFVRVRVGAKPHDIASLEAAAEIQVPFPSNCTYAHLIRRPGTSTMALLTRNSDGWYVSTTTNWGTTWGAARRFHGLAYATFRLVGHIAKYAITYHPVTTSGGSIKYLSIDTNSGDVINAAGTVVGNLWTGSTVIGVASMTGVAQTTAPEGLRTFDVGRGGSIAAMKLDQNAPELGGTYGVYRHAGADNWVWEPVVHSGVPVGYYQSGYVGGMGFGGNDDSVWLAREDGGTWSLERWEKVNTTWMLVDTIRTRTDGQLGRPQIPWGAEGTGLFTAIEYHRYLSDSFMDYYGDQVAWETGITETVISAPLMSVTATAPTVNDLEYTIPSKTGVRYLVNGATTAAGTYTGVDGQSLTITAEATDGYILVGTTSWTFALVAPVVAQELVTTGSLMYVDATQWSAGVPTTTVPNLADGSTMDVQNTLVSSDGAAERTSLGGLHVAISQTTAAQNKFFGLASETVRAHMDANIANDYYVAALFAMTRHTDVVPNSDHHKMVGAWGTVSNDSATIRPVSNNKVSVVPSSYRTAYQETATPAPLGAALIVDGAVSQIPDIGSDPNLVRFGSGRNAENTLKGTSWVLYAAYIEDLTVSGRSYTQAHDAFLAKHPASSVAGDTWTAPATLAP